MLRGFPGEDELSEEASDHLGLDLYVFELVAVVDADGLADELGDDGQVPAVGPDDLSGLCRLQLVEQELLLVVQAAGVVYVLLALEERSPRNSSKGMARSSSIVNPRKRNSVFLLAWIADAFFLDFLLEAFADPAIIVFAIAITS